MLKYTSSFSPLSGSKRETCAVMRLRAAIIKMPACGTSKYYISFTRERNVIFGSYSKDEYSLSLLFYMCVQRGSGAISVPLKELALIHARFLKKILPAGLVPKVEIFFKTRRAWPCGIKERVPNFALKIAPTLWRTCKK